VTRRKIAPRSGETAAQPAAKTGQRPGGIGKKATTGAAQPTAAQPQKRAAPIKPNDRLLPSQTQSGIQVAHDDWVLSVAFSPDGTRLATWGRNRGQAWACPRQRRGTPVTGAQPPRSEKRELQDRSLYGFRGWTGYPTAPRCGGSRRPAMSGPQACRPGEPDTCLDSGRTCFRCSPHRQLILALAASQVDGV
jgi:hypothetical protein